MHLVGLNWVGDRRRGPELAGSRPVRPRSAFLGARALESRSPPLGASARSPDSTYRVPESLLTAISQQASPSPLDPDVWHRVLSEAEVPGKDTIVAALRHGVPLSLTDAPFPRVCQPNHPMLYFDLSRVLNVVHEEVQNGRYVELPPSTDPSLLNISAMGGRPSLRVL